MVNKEPKKIDVVFFDLGFTLINFVGDFHHAMGESYNALAAALINEGCGFDMHEFAKKYREIITNYYHLREIDLIERPIEESLHKTLKHFNCSGISDKKIQKAILAMFTVTEAYWQLESDTHETLQALISKGYRLGLISNASNTPDISRLIEMHDLRKYFELVVISAEEKIRKPDSRIYQRALERMKVKSENAIMVGDTLTADILGAQQVGMQAVWISRRAMRPENQRELDHIKPDFTIQNLSSLIPILEKI